jgi:hypothetical protein
VRRNFFLNRVVEKFNKIPSTIENSQLSDRFQVQIKQPYSGHGGTNHHGKRSWRRNRRRDIGIDYIWPRTLPERPYLSHHQSTYI